MKPKILISGFQGPCTNYIQAIESAGGLPEAKYCPTYSAEYDGLLFTGGADLDPSFYHSDDKEIHSIDRDRDLAEFELLNTFLSLRKPVLGICRGHQLINVGLGGTLIPHIGEELCQIHRITPDHQDRVHVVCSQKGSWYESTYGSRFSVNSAHHQAISQLADGLIPVLWSESGLIEAVEHESLPVFAVQFHPERMTGAKLRPDTVDGALIFQRFLHLI